MLQPTITEGLKAYAVSLYNREVRALVKANESHAFFGDHWADSQLQDVIAKTEKEARKLISDRYPPEHGFVVEGMSIINN